MKTKQKLTATDWSVARKRLFSKEELEYIDKNRKRLEDELLKELREESMADTGKVIKKARHEKGFSQEKLAKLLKTDRANISRMENGRENVSIAKLRKIAFALGKELKIEIV